MDLSNTMLPLITVPKAQKKLAEFVRAKRLQMNLTQSDLAKRSGVALPTLRKFEQKGAISLESYLKLQLILGNLEHIIKASEPTLEEFSSIDDVLDEDKQTRQRARRT